jgi:Flp pilus assembly protein TadG
MRTEPRPTADKSDAMNGDDGGFVIVWMALMLLVLLAFCGFGIDVSHWWFVGQKQQRAADAAALAGSIYLPNDLATGQATAASSSCPRAARAAARRPPPLAPDRCAHPSG